MNTGVSTDPHRPSHVLISRYVIKTSLWTVEPAVSRGPRMGKKGAAAYVILSMWLTTYQLWSTVACASDSPEGPHGTEERLGLTRKRGHDPC